MGNEIIEIFDKEMYEKLKQTFNDKEIREWLGFGAREWEAIRKALGIESNRVGRPYSK